MFYKTEDLLTSIKTRTLAPTSQSTFTDLDLIQLANEELQSSLVPDVLSVREDFFLRKCAIPLVSNLDHYLLPERAIGNALKEVFYVDSVGNRRTIPRTKLHNLPLVTSYSALPVEFYLKGDEVVLLPIPTSATGSLELWYFSRPNKLVPTTQTGQILTINIASNVATVSLDTDISSSVSPNSKVDFLRATSPFNNACEDVVVSTIAGSVITVPLTSIQNEVGVTLPKPGDYVAVSQTGNFIQLPQEFHPILAQMVAGRLMEALGDIQKLQAVNAKLGEMRKQAFTLISNRVESELPVIRNPRGMLGSLSSRI